MFADLSEDVYFMPCLLQVVSSEVVARYRVSEEKALAVHFPNSGPLMGMFCSTVAYLLSPENAHPCHWEVVKNEAGTPICLNRNVIEFSVSDLAGTVSLIDHFTHFKIHIHTHPKKMERMWRLAHDTVFAGMEKARKTLGYKNNIPVPAMVCPIHTATPHPATVDKDYVWKCSNESRYFGDVVEGTIPWWTVCSKYTQTYMYMCPSLVTLVLPHVCTCMCALLEMSTSRILCRFSHIYFTPHPTTTSPYSFLSSLYSG